MNIAIIGYGKMGKAVKNIAKMRGHSILLCYDQSPHNHILKNIDVVIEFSQPDSAFNNVKFCIEKGIPTVCGTTGWLDKIGDIKKICKEKKGSFLYSSNFSIGMNIVYEINRKLSKLLSLYSNEYKITIEEIHHKNKLDQPSGTSISLANDIINSHMKKNWILGKSNNHDCISIISKRFSEEVGTHTITFHSNIDDIKIQHKSFNRNSFALGAVIAAEWIKNKIGFFSMKEVLKINGN
ncbi:4-hydroxy-tetrahydrodipicolinate reductase [Blattabacterium cuenoti]|uniref:4-hydroxy-tetrahydrodipicolinate reductase n=1 Tax=Blattabacterium cuenoti TaxID=1653831 RepID=UPI00163CD3B9|nr:4-hydroxy-tetrahydrodipicolinate reductase [Blattabacterium cuenoti]